jgi:peptidoglycan pentaglycine glycine transferase (the first glycine)
MKPAEMQAFGGTGQEWNALVADLHGAHLLQTWEWAHVKSAFGWEPLPFVWRTSSGPNDTSTRDESREGAVVAAAMVLRRPVLSRGFVRRLCVLYVPKGPLLDPNRTSLRIQVLTDLRSLGRKLGAILVKVDPDVEMGQGYPGGEVCTHNPVGAAWEDLLRVGGWRFSEAQIQFRNSVWIDISAPADEVLSRMKQKTRYNIRLAERRGVQVRSGGTEDIPMLYRMYSETADRDGFVIRSEDYYRTVWGTFFRVSGSTVQPSAEALVAEVQGEPIAALLLFRFAGRAYYLYGMSRATHREMMPNHLLQWEAIRRAQKWGCGIYDLWGAPDTFTEADPMWGVFRFKEGLGGQVVRTIGAWDYPTGGLWYLVYTRIIPRVLDVMRWRGRRQIHDSIDAA